MLFSYIGRTPHLLAPTADSDKSLARGLHPQCWDEVAQSRLGVTAPQAMQSAIAQLIVLCKINAFSYIARTPQLLAPTNDFDRTKHWRRHPYCWDEAAPSGLGVAASQGMQSAISADDWRQA